jgi:hypothetical protein
VTAAKRRPVKKVPTKQRAVKKHQPTTAKVRVTFQKAGRSPSQRKTVFEYGESNFTNGRNPLNVYLVENEDSGIPLSELVEQFQEYDCAHRMEEAAVWFNDPNRVTHEFRCAICGLVQKKTKER